MDDEEHIAKRMDDDEDELKGEASEPYSEAVNERKLEEIKNKINEMQKNVI